MINNNNLFFLISQPRAGSTLLQKMLSCHPDIHTMSEPWLMLNPIYALRGKGVEAEYGARIANRALNDVIESLPNQKEDYYQGLRQMYGHLYDCLLQGTGKSYFLDKTPRYYFIIDELYNVFPNAKFIILLRNPMAVFCSIMKTWIKKDFSKFKYYKNDLLEAPNLLTDGINNLNKKCIVVHYEKLLANPEEQIQKILEYLQLKIDLSIIDYSNNTLDLSGKRGDKTKITNNTKPNHDNLDTWMTKLQNPQIWKFSNDYLRILGSDTISQLGYSYEDLQQILNDNRPKKLSVLTSISLKKALNI